MGDIRCATCGVEVNDGAAVCPNCGGEASVGPAGPGASLDRKIARGSLPGAPPRLPTLDVMRYAAVATLTALVVIGLVLFAIEIRTILLWVLIGIVLAIGLQPAVAWLMRRGWRHTVAALTVSFATIAAAIGVIVALAIPLVRQADDFIVALPDLVQSEFSPGGRLAFIDERFDLLDRLSKIDPNDVLHAVSGSGGTIVGIIGGAASFVAAVVTVTTIMVMLLIEGPRAWQAILDALVGEERVWADRIGQNFLRAVGGYVRGNLTISVVAGIGSYIVMKILGVPYAETLAVMVAILDIIPLVGATIGAVIVSIVGFATGGGVDGVVLVVYFVAYQQFENNLLQNVVYSKTVSLSPLIVFIAALIGASVGGIVGVLLAIPLTSAGWVLARDLIALRRERHEAGAASELGEAALEATAEPGSLPSR
jgi:predicted PurR-regulated permease PerM